jgi:hypothetical protein
MFGVAKIFSGLYPYRKIFGKFERIDLKKWIVSQNKQLFEQ